jgi:nitrogenase molybdenum-iron protein beta chain
MSQIIEEAKFTCALGAQQTVLGIERAIPIIHAGPGCSARQFGYLGTGSGYQGEGYAGGGQIPCSNTSQNEVVFGGEKKLRKLVEATKEVMDGDFFVILAGCTAGIVGDDIQQVAADYNTDEQPVIGVDTAGFRGNNYKGHELVVSAILEQLLAEAEPQVEKGLVNVFSVVPYQDAYWRGDLEEIKRILEGIGLKVNVLYGYGSGGLQEWRSIPNAELNLVLSPWVGVSAAKFLERRFGTPYLHETSLPVGLKATSAFLRRVAEKLSLDSARVETFIGQEESRYKKYFVSLADIFSDLASYLPYDAYFAGDDIYGVGTAEFVTKELGMTVAGFYDVSEPTATGQKTITQALEKIDLAILEGLKFEPDNALIRKDIKEKIAKRHNKAVIFGSGWDKELAYETDNIIVYQNVPVVDAVVLNKTFVGYNGGLTLIQDIYSGVFNKGMITNTTHGTDSII